MPPRTSARRYAEAAFQIAERDGTVDRWRAELQAAARALGSEDVTRGLGNPAVPLQARSDALDRALGGSLSEPVRNLIYLLLRRGRIDLLRQVAAEFQRLDERRRGITRAIVTSAAPLEHDERSAIEERLREMTHGEVLVDHRVDPAILGGVMVRLGDRLIDGSVRGRLERLRDRLAAGAL